MLRTCLQCRFSKPADAFGVDATKPDGLNTSCKSCRAEFARGRRAAAKRGPAPVVELRPGLRLVEVAPVPPAPEPQATAPLPPVGGGQHRVAFEQAIAAATWLTPVHAAAVSYARSLSDLLDAASLEGLLPGRSEPQYLLALKALGLVVSATKPDESDIPVHRPSAANY